MDIKEHLATKVMGYTLERPHKHTGNPSQYKLGDKFICLDYLYDPLHNEAQAMALLDKCDDMNRISKTPHPKGYEYECLLLTDLIVGVSYKSRAEAIVNAVATATGYID